MYVYKYVRGRRRRRVVVFNRQNKMALNTSFTFKLYARSLPPPPPHHIQKYIAIAERATHAQSAAQSNISCAR